jgi:hypothetical protein
MNYVRIGSLAGVLLLCGCQAPTPEQARLQQPVFQGQSTRTVPQLSSAQLSSATVFIAAGPPPALLPEITPPIPNPMAAK